MWNDLFFFYSHDSEALKSKKNLDEWKYENASEG